MKKKLLTLLTIIGLTAGVCAFTACKEENTPTYSGSSSSSSDIEEGFAFNWKISMPNGIEYQNVTTIPTMSLYERCTIKVEETGAKFVSETPSVATVSELGVVSVIGTGEAKITVTVGKDTQTVKFTANDAGNVPVVVFNASNVLQDETGYYCNIMQGRSVNTGVGIKYNGIDYTDVTFQFDSSDDEIATFVDGKIQGVKEGTATLTVSASSWREYTGKNLSQTLTVNVRPDLSLNVSKDEIALYATKLTDEMTSLALEPIVAVNSVTVENATFTYSGYDEEVVSVDNAGVVSAVGEGSTEIKIKYTTAGGGFIEKTVAVTVVLPIAETTIDLQLDKSTGETLSRETFGMTATDTFKRIEDKETGKKATITADGVADLDALPSGIRDLIVYTQKQGYQIKATIVDKVIMTANDLLTLGTDHGATADWFTYEGYFLLGRDIDCTGVTISTAGDTFQAGGAFNGLGFSGTFDGQGHTISNATFALGGLFGRLENATVKNLAITGATLQGIASSCIAYGINNGKIDNVFIDYKKNGSPLSSAALLAYQNEGASEITNFVAYIRSMSSNTTNCVASLFTRTISKPKTMENVYVITAGMTVNEYYTHTQHKNPETEEVTVIAHEADFEEVKTYTSVEDFQDANHDLTVFNDYWDTTGEYPVFKKKATTLLNVAYVYELASNADYTFSAPTAEVVAVEIGTQAFDFTIESGKITLDKAELASITAGEYTLTIDTATVTYKGTVTVATKIIDSAEELKALQTTENVNGYYLLGANIENLGEFSGITSGVFEGVFDGRGYTVSGATFTANGGLLGKKANNTTVKNLAITNSSFVGSASAALVSGFTGACVVENVFISLNKPSAWSNSNCVLAYSVQDTLTVKNAVCYIVDKWGEATATFVSWTENKESTVTCENVYCGSNVGLAYVNTNTGSITGVTNYASLSAMQADYEAEKIDLSAFENLGFKTAIVDLLSK